MDRRKLIRTLACSSLVAACPAFAFDRINYVAGLPVGTFDNTHLFVEPGSIALWDGNPGWGIIEVELTEIIKIDMNHVGINGRDTGSFSDGCYLVYMLYDPIADVKGFVASKAIDIGGVVKPPGFKAWRKIQYGATVLGGRVLPTHAANYPMPTVTFTDRLQVATLTANTNGWAPLNLSNYVPANARLAQFHAELSGLASLWMAPNGNVPNAFYRPLALNQGGCTPTISTRIDSNQTVFVWLGTSGVTALIFLDGFSMTEVS